MDAFAKRWASFWWFLWTTSACNAFECRKANAAASRETAHPIPKRHVHPHPHQAKTKRFVLLALVFLSPLRSTHRYHHLQDPLPRANPCRRRAPRHEARCQPGSSRRFPCCSQAEVSKIFSTISLPCQKHFPSPFPVLTSHPPRHLRLPPRHPRSSSWYDQALTQIITFNRDHESFIVSSTSTSTVTDPEATQGARRRDSHRSHGMQKAAKRSVPEAALP